MDERFQDEFVTWHHKTPVGIKVDEVFGMDSKSGKVWEEMARQIFAEQGVPDYRVICHFADGAPYIEGYPGRISLTHTNHFFAVAILPKTPEIKLDSFNPRAAMGIDAEPLSRDQVLKVRNKFLSETEQIMIPEDDVPMNILAWTAKEALYKAALCTGLNLIENIKLIKLPSIDDNPETNKVISLGDALLTFPSDLNIPSQEMKIYSYVSYGCCVSIAFSPKCAKFGK
ncbi:MAG: 4'-phosphopantetheinyl transferase superfamily protein [Muribaculaceae bacterium]|nr:4'-phosphopantetheinyl transferase superfamily protein [Muribaculaceae bacterium]